MPLALLGLPISFDRPAWLWLLLAIPVLAGVSLRTLAGLDRRRRVLAIVMRSLVIAALTVALARVQFVKRNEHVAVMFVLDRSKSIPDALRLKAQEYIRETVKAAQKIDHEARFGVISFDGQADVDVVPSRVGANILEFGVGVEPNRTNIAAGVRMALAAFPEGYARRLVLLTDGNQNEGDVSAEIEAALAGGVAVDVVPLRFKHDNEILFDRIWVPTQVQKETRIPVRLIVKSTRPTKARLTLYHNDREVGIDPAHQVLDLSGGMRPDRFDVTVELRDAGRAEGVHRFDARLTPLDEAADVVAENNKATAFTFTQNPQQVLILAMPGSQDEVVLRDALAREMGGTAGGEGAVRLVTLDQFRDGIDLETLQAYGTIILSNIPADEFNEKQHRDLANYVRDMGRGLIMIGGENGFGAGGWIGKPLEEVSPVSFEIKQEKKMPRGALVIIMHSCEIPRGNYWGQQVAIAAINTISSLDYLGVISYSYNPGGPHWDVPLAPAADKRAILRAVTQMQNGDMMDFDPMFRQAVGALLSLKDASQKHIIVISDGDPGPPSPEIIQKMVDARITASTVGIGYGAHVVEKTLRDIAVQTHASGGEKHFYRCTNPNLLPQIFVKEAKIVRRSLLQDFRPPVQPRLPGFDPIVAGLDAVPPIGGMVLTTPKADISLPLVRVSDRGTDPVLAYWNIGAGKMAVFTSGLWRGEWGTHWASWDRFGKFWAQIVRWSMGDSSPASFDVVARQDGGKGKISFEAVNKDASYLTNLRITNAHVFTPAGESKPLFVTQVGPGQYEASFDVADTGSYLGSIHYKYVDASEGQPKVLGGQINTGLSVSYSPEFRELGTNETLLRGIADKTGGQLLALDPIQENVFKRKLPPSVSRQPVWRWVVQWLLLPLFLLDVAGRRLASTLALSLYVEAAVFVTFCATLHAGGAPAWSYVLALIVAEAVGWAIRWRYILPTIQYFTYGVTALARAGQRSTQSLSQLKDVRAKVREGLTGQDEGPARPGPRESSTIPLEPVADRRTRFDVGDAAAAKPARDLTDVVGGARAEEPAERKKAGPGQAGELTSRLLKAKQRAQEEMKKNRGEDKTEPRS
ncbi:MAG: VWA domain-containing protein [Phycisphaerae bacterium]|jgi:uncharacterized membrane protein